MTLDEELAEMGVGEAAAVLPPPAAPSNLQKMQTARPPASRAPGERDMLTVVGPETVHPMAAQWEKWRPRFAEAMDGSYHTVEGVEQAIFQGRAQFWPGKNAAIITEIVEYPGERALQGTWAAGDIAEVLEIIPGIEAFARLSGCTSSLVEGRAGWTKALKGLGYAPWSVTLRKPL